MVSRTWQVIRSLGTGCAIGCDKVERVGWPMWEIVFYGGDVGVSGSDVVIKLKSAQGKQVSEPEYQNGEPQGGGDKSQSLLAEKR